ncbi:hypothetical protein FACS1894142_0330 [Spirochaetia bacterium]|nr:hypothetical protein FACS1894142_0330 [Spirochaetia bacterium]
MNTSPRLVYVVFKTHLDIGYTDLAATVMEKYIHEFIPMAVKTAAELRQRGGKERFVWTTGSWLIHTYLKQADEQSRNDLIQAIHAGDIVWHALPFTTHTELMDTGLCEYGLSLSAGLDKQFGKTTIAAKMTDVPGHTIGLVPLLARRGVRYLHIGVNGGSKMPEVPRVFRWQAPDGSGVIVQYDQSYGETLILPGIDEALVIVNSNDNSGPPQTESILRIYADLEQQFPGAEIRASTLSDFVPVLEKADLPVVTEEIGDTWIHGIGSDPCKVARYRELLRLRKGWEAAGSLQPGAEAYERFYDELLMIPEHTWGLDMKRYLGDFKNWSVLDFHRARNADKVSLESSIPVEYEAIRQQIAGDLKFLNPDKSELWDRQRYSFFESSHREQRAYIDAAVKALPETLQKEAAAAFKAMQPERPLKPSSDHHLHPGDGFTLGPWEAVIGDSGAIVSLQGFDGKELAAPETGIGAYSYQTFSFEDYARYHQDYNRNLDTQGSWIIPDFGKPGMQYAKPRAVHARYSVHIRSITRRVMKDGYDEVEVRLQASPDVPRGAPRSLIIRYRAHKTATKLEVKLDWFDKDVTRLPEALWFSMNLNAATPGRWRFSKMGTLINPLDVVKGGNRSYHGIDWAEYRGCDAHYVITPLDSPLAAIGKPKMLQFDDRFEDPAGGIHFNLYNNIWGTNFPMWYEEDGRSRFIIEFC